LKFVGRSFVAQRVEVSGDVGLHLRQIVFVDGAALGAEAEAVVLDFEEGDGVAARGEVFVEEEDGGFDAGVGIEAAGGERDDGDEGLVDEEFAQFFVGGLALEDDAFGDNDGGAARLWGLMPPFGDMKGGLARMTSANSFQRSSEVRLSYS